MDSTPTTQKRVSDLGASAYLLMHGFKVVARDGRDIIFEVSQEDVNNFEDTNMAYLTSEFHHFDSCLMSLKKLAEFRRTYP